jgi:FlaA1/EpsC-like NDP-sugar epimerase
MRRLAIFGCGVKGRTVNFSIKIDKQSSNSVIFFIDDNSAFHGTKVDGIPVVSFSEFLSLQYDTQTTHLIWAVNLHTANVRHRMGQVRDACSSLGVEVLYSPITNELLGPPKKIVDEDFYNYLLGRAPIVIDNTEVKEKVGNQRVMVTGAAGSIGSEIVRQLVLLGVGKLILMDNAESGLEGVSRLLDNLKYTNYSIVLGDVRSDSDLNLAFSHEPNIVYHAAAYKHVPILEDFPIKALEVNITGTYKVAMNAMKCGVSKFVLISTDKAVNPTNVMGASKRLCELIIQRLGLMTDRMVFITTRFGNVLGSNGSVVPKFLEQLKNTQTLTVTHKDVIRYFMTIPEAAQLVIQAADIGNMDEIFLFEMGEPVKIYELAERIIKYYNYQLGVNASIEVTGLRKGEKLYEELLTQSEFCIASANEKIKIARKNPLNTTQIEEIDNFLENMEQHSDSSFVSALKSIITEFNHKTI